VLGSAIPAFAGIAYTCDPNIDLAHAGTCAYLNSTIAALYNTTFTNANASIYIQYGPTDLGASNTSLTVLSYRQYLNALTASAQTSGNTVQIAAVKALNSLDTTLHGTDSVVVPSALAAALGIANPLFGLVADGTGFCSAPGTEGCYHGIITITNEAGVLYYRSGVEGRNQYDFYSTVEHETDEVLGTASCIDTTNPSGLTDGCPGTDTPSAVDLFRYQSTGNPVLIGTTPSAYFSYDGGVTNGAGTKMKVYNTLDDSLDYADFTSSFPCQAAQSVQDAQGCPGQDHGLDITNDGGAEINILNAVGYMLNAQPAVPPVISNVLNGATGQSTLAASTYGAIYGAGLSTTNPGRQWAAADFTTNANGTLNMPTSLDGTSVTIQGTPAYISYISPTQVNFITPAIAATGNGVQVILSLNGQENAAFPVTLQPLAPSFFAWDPGTPDNGKYLVAQHADYTNVGKPGLFSTAPPTFTTPAVPGETVLLYGTGFGPTIPPIASGIETDKVYNLSPTPTATLGGIAARVSFAGLIPPESQLYQFNVVIPPNASNGDLPLIVNVNGTLSVSGLITVQK